MKKKLNLKVRWFKILLGIYLFLFIFTMVNREFRLFGFDLRYVELPLGALILFVNLISKKYRVSPEKDDGVGRALILFYVFVLFSNIAWIWNGLDISKSNYINEIILIINVLVGMMVFYANKSRLNYYLMNSFVIFSCFILVVSILLIHQGFTLAEISGASDVAYVYRSAETVDNSNFFGESMRIAGYAADPNYATMLLLIGIVVTFKLLKKNFLKAIFTALFVFGIGLSFSRTVVLIALIAAVYIVLIRLFHTRTGIKFILNRVIILLILTIVVLIPHMQEFTANFPLTLTQRFSMWRHAGDLFLANPIIGGGLTSFRSYFLVDNWYVQAHSTYWQVISELGIIGMILYYRVISKALDKSVGCSLNYFLTIVFLVWIMTCESIALPFSIFVYYLLSIGPPKEDTKGKAKKALFFVNSLKQGGAERVCVNMAEEILSEGGTVDYVVLNNSGDSFFKGNKRVRIINLKICGPKFLKILEMPIKILKVNSLIFDSGEKYTLVTSHLPMSNLITRFSSIGERAIYVFHTKIDSYSIGPSWLYKTVMGFLFGNRKVVTVSDGLRGEYLKKYDAEPELVRTIYNPVNVDNVKKLARDDIPEKSQFFLNVGRFTVQKRQDRVLKIFKDGGFDKDYVLVFCGTGELEDKVKEEADKLGISDKVRCMGYQENIYAWMKHASIMISASDVEAFPMNLVEAIAIGTRVVSSKCNYGPAEILTGEYADFLVEPNDISGYITKIKRALKKYPTSYPEVLEKCSPKMVISQYEEFYKA